VNIFVLSEITKGFAKRNVRDNIDGEELRLLREVARFIDILGRQIFPFEKLYEVDDIIVDGFFEVLNLFPRVLQLC
jgi:hypothetical protein